MRLEDLKQGEAVTLEVIIGGSNYEFPTTVLSKKNAYILTEPVRVEGKIVGFSGTNITLNLILDREDKSPLVWKGIGCSIVSLKGVIQYKIVASGEGFEMNRRNAYRIFVGIEGVAQMGINHKAVGVMVKDVSETGFSFVSEENMENSENVAVRLVFADMDKNFSLMGLVVRKEVLEEKKIVYGCKLSMRNQMLPRYIVDKQRQKLLMNKRSVSYETEESIQQSLRKAAPTERRSKKSFINSDKGGAQGVNNVEKETRREIFKENKAGRKSY